jgi:hypothetical protein
MKVDDLPTIKTIASECYNTTKGDIQKSVKIMANKIRGDDVLFRALLDPLVESACYTEITHVCRTNRSSIWEPPNYQVGGSGHRIVCLAESNLMAFPLPGGLPLGRATKEEVMEAAEFYTTQGKDMLQKGQWLKMIAEKLPKGKSVSKVLTEQQLSELQKAALSE